MSSVINLLVYNNGKYQFSLANTISSRIAFNRNMLVTLAREQGATHILFIDADMTFPNNALDRLVAHGKDIVGATAARRKGRTDAVGNTLDGGPLHFDEPLVRMELLGLPFMLIDLKVFEKLRAPWFAEPPTEDGGLVAEDEYFCDAALAAGYDIWCDTKLSLEMGHIGSKIYYIGKE